MKKQYLDCESYMIHNFKEIIKKYKNISIKYEYSHLRRRLLVSYSSKAYIFNNENLLCEINKIEDNIKFKFVNYPLFCYDEELFELTDKAKNLNYENIQAEKI